MATKVEPRLLGWIGWAGLDAIGRLALLTGSTAVFSRLLSPRDFGISALVLTVVAVASVFVGAPFEEALAQRRVLRRIHLQAALAASWAVGVGMLLASVLAGWLMAAGYDAPEMRWLLPIASLSIFFSGHSDITTALARRLRRFNDVAFATLAGHVVGIAIALAIAFAGGGVSALIAQRLLVVVARAAILQWRIGFLVRPRWSPAHLGDIGRFAGFSFLDRLVDNLTYLAFNNLVGAVYGITVLGYVNMAMRLIEPIRGAVVATGHNLAFSYFAVVAGDRHRLHDRAAAVVGRAAYVIAPVFLGLAAIIPALLPLVAGPGWDAAIGIAVCLAIGSTLAVPARLVYTALSASARPEFSLLSSVAGFAATVLVLLAAGPLGPISVGLARIAGDGVQAALAIGLSPDHLAWSRRDRLAALLPAWALAGVMALALVALSAVLPPIGNLARLVVEVLFGVGLYGGLLALFARPTLGLLVAMVRQRRSAPTALDPDR